MSQLDSLGKRATLLDVYKAYKPLGRHVLGMAHAAFEMTDELTRGECELMAEFVGRFGSRRYASSVDYADNKLEVRIPVQYEQGGDELVFVGALVNGQLSGHTRIDEGEESAE